MGTVLQLALGTVYAWSCRQQSVMAAGGGGILVVKERGQLVGVEAVIDKDLASGVLARMIGADCLRG